jgi:glucokinase
MKADPGWVAAVDWGGTWIRVAAVVGDSIVCRHRTARPAALRDQYATIAALVGNCVTEVASPPRAIAVGLAGVIQLDAVMTAINLGIHDATPVVQDLQTLLGAPVFVMNDIQAAAMHLSRRWPNGTSAVLSIGTGIGGAVIVDGRLWAGNGAAGDFGHLVISYTGSACACGGTGCLEAEVSGKLLAEAAQRLASTGQSELLRSRQHSGRVLHAGDLQDAADAGEAAATAELVRSADAFAAGMRSVVAAIDPARIIVVGQLLSDEVTFGQLVRRRWAQLRPRWSNTDVVYAPDDADAPLLGVAHFARTQLPDCDREHS